MDENLLKISDFAKKSGVSTKTLRKWHNKGILEAKVGINGYRYYKDSDIEKAKKLKADCYRRRAEKKLLILYYENDKEHEAIVREKISSLRNHEQYREYEILTMKYSKNDIESNEKVYKQILSRIHEKIFLVIDRRFCYEEDGFEVLLLGLLKAMKINIELIENEDFINNNEYTNTENIEHTENSIYNAIILALENAMNEELT